MFLRSKRFMCFPYKNVSKRLLSNEIKEIFSTRLDPPNGINGNQLQLAFVSKNLNAVNLDLFVNNLSQHDDKSLAVLELLENIRSTKFANTCLESTHFAVVKHLLENLTMQELITVLVDRPKYGIFLNNFTSFAVTETLYEAKEYILGLPLILKLVLSDEIESVFVQGFCLKSSMETLKKELLDDQPCEDKNSTPKAKVIEKKVRVKYIRNESVPDVHREIGKALLRIESIVLDVNISANIRILGLILTKNYAELYKFLTKSVDIHRDVADICKKLLSKRNQTDFINMIEKLQSEQKFENFIDGFLNEVSANEATSLAEKQKLLLPIWQQLREQKKIEFEKEIARKERKDNIDSIWNEINTKKELLWFFDKEEELDLEICKRQELRSKKWVDKKKDSRDEDEHYVPPEIRKID